jgi:hypothetical protein
VPTIKLCLYLNINALLAVKCRKFWSKVVQAKPPIAPTVAKRWTSNSLILPPWLKLHPNPHPNVRAAPKAVPWDNPITNRKNIQCGLMKYI